jgi:energy-coupling factor transport system ATP-binding protein
MSPFELSGGQKRRVAIAGVLAMRPEILILDEPVAGLDPAGRKELLDMLRQLNQDGMSILLVSHNMDDVADYADRVLVMEQGRLLYDDSVEAVFAHATELKQLGLDVPVINQLMRHLKQSGDAIQELMKYIGQ